MLKIFTNTSLGPRPACLPNTSTGGNENVWPLEVIMLLTLVSLTGFAEGREQSGKVAVRICPSGVHCEMHSLFSGLL